MTLRIGIAGMTGRMGKLLAQAVPASGAELAGGVGRDEDLVGLALRSDLVIDFTHADTVELHAQVLADASTAWVLGTTGFSTADLAAIQQAAARIPIIASPNFSPGVNLLLILAEQLATALPPETYDAEILEMHHRQKVDAPSGTAFGIGRAVAAGRGVDLADVMVSARHGHLPPRQDGEIGFAALRGGQMAGSHSLMFTAADEQISLTHHAFDRRVFATGALRAAHWLHGKPPGLYSMKDVLGLSARS